MRISQFKRRKIAYIQLVLFLKQKESFNGPSRLGRKQSLQALAGEIIGMQAKVAKSNGKGMQGIEGTIEDETQNTLVFKTAKGTKRVPKAQAAIEFPALGITVSGKLLQARPEDRTKKLLSLASKTQ